MILHTGLMFACLVASTSGQASPPCTSIDETTSDQWCTENCLNTPANCPQDKCTCEGSETGTEWTCGYINVFNENHQDYASPDINENIDDNTYNIPENYNMYKIVEDLTIGDGYAILKKAVSQRDIKELKERVIYHTKNNQEKQTLKSMENLTLLEKQNHFDGLIWSLLNKGHIFEKLLLHPSIQNISRVLMGESAQLLSYTANTVSPGQGGQTPHLDYPYYPYFFSQDEKYGPPLMKQPLAIVFITLLTDFTKLNGGTALRPKSHMEPTFPEDQDEFFANAVQVEGKAGDIVVLRSSLQHCAMSNMSGGIRSGVIIHMGPNFIRPYENIPASLDQAFKNRASNEMRIILGLDNPFPRLKE